MFIVLLESHYKEGSHSFFNSVLKGRELSASYKPPYNHRYIARWASWASSGICLNVFEKTKISLRVPGNRTLDSQATTQSFSHPYTANYLITPLALEMDI